MSRHREVGSFVVVLGNFKYAHSLFLLDLDLALLLQGEAARNSPSLLPAIQRIHPACLLLMMVMAAGVHPLSSSGCWIQSQRDQGRAWFRVRSVSSSTDSEGGGGP